MQYLIYVVLLVLVGCTPSDPESTRYFPLTKGHVWEYEVTTNLINSEYSYPLTIETLGTSTFKEQAYFIRRTSQGTEYYLQADDLGIKRYGKRFLVENSPQFDPTPQLVLPHPNQAKVGFTWSMSSVPYTLHRIMPNPEPPSSQGYHFNMAFSLLNLDETVSTPAGTFEHCWLVEGEAQLNVFADARKGYTDLAITQREWYAPNVGLVKLERDEPLDAEVFKGGKITMELTRFQ